jgi:hypothetical protein
MDVESRHKLTAQAIQIQSNPQAGAAQRLRVRSPVMRLRG